jgi:hypothetical protein
MPRVLRAGGTTFSGCCQCRGAGNGCRRGWREGIARPEFLRRPVEEEDSRPTYWQVVRATGGDDDEDSRRKRRDSPLEGEVHAERLERLGRQPFGGHPWRPVARWNSRNLQAFGRMRFPGPPGEVNVHRGFPMQWSRGTPASSTIRRGWAGRVVAQRPRLMAAEVDTRWMAGCWCSRGSTGRWTNPTQVGTPRSRSAVAAPDDFPADISAVAVPDGIAVITRGEDDQEGVRPGADGERASQFSASLNGGCRR